MKVKLLVSRSGPLGAFNRGDIIDVPDEEVVYMLAAEQCILLEQEPEKATKKTISEKATKK